MTKKKNGPLVLAILDGFGVAPDSKGNGVTKARTPYLNKCTASYPSTTLIASGESVGLNWGDMGNSEVGHTNIGSGLVFYQSMPKINQTIRDESFFTNKAMLKLAGHVKEHRSQLHIMGLLGTGGVHAHQEHWYAALKFAKKQKLKKVFLHLFLDGRDTIYNSGKGFVGDLQKQINELCDDAEIASVSGRFYAMDRDNHWERVEPAYAAIARGEAASYAKDPLDAITSSYKKEVYDEQFVPIVVGKEGKPVATVENGDGLLFLNFRGDRARQLVKAFMIPGFDKFPVTQYTRLHMTCFTEYESNLPVDVAFPPHIIKQSLPQTLATHGLRQLHIAETEKYAHVTFFFSGGIEDPYDGEDRIVIPSPRVASYAEKPQMSAKLVTDAIVKKIAEDAHDVIIVNFANPDMVGHTGDIRATIKAVETVDEMLSRIGEIVMAKGGTLIITADHGNAEELINLQTGEIDKEHSTNPVPFIIVGAAWEGKTLGLPEGVGGDLSLVTPTGILADISPTILKLLDISQPNEMTGTPLI